MTARLDFETASQAGYYFDPIRQRWHGPPRASQGKKGLPVIGARVYAEHPSTRVLCAAYNLDDGQGDQFWRPGLPPPEALLAHVRAGKPLEAWNVGFERWIWELVCVPRMGWPPVAMNQWRCAMSTARAHALPGALAKAGEVLGAAVTKDARGGSLLDTFSMPRNPTKGDPRLWIDPLWTMADVQAQPDSGDTPRQREKWREGLVQQHLDTLALGAYNVRDIQAEAAVSSAIPPLSADEFAYWQDDQRINHRGVRIDMDGVHDCIAIIEQAERRYGDEIATLTGGIAASEIKQLQGWLHAQNVHLDSLDEDSVSAALKWLPPGPPRRALEIRAAIGSASVKKVFAMRNQTSRAGRLHDLYTFFGARTGRPTSQGAQAANLPKAGPHTYRCDHCGKYHGAHTMWCHWCGTFTLRAPGKAREWNPEAAEDALAAISYRSLDYLELLFGDALLAVAGVLRSLFIASEGCEMVSSDFTAIEGVVIAALAGEQWRLDAFAQDRSLYVESASRAFNVPVEEMERHKEETGQHHPLRQVGKGMELGLGFGGWINALRQFDVEGDDDKLKSYVLAWRDASAAIVEFWGGQSGGPGASSRWEKRRYGLEGAAISAVENPGTYYPVTRLDGTASCVGYVCNNDVLYCRVPSGGLITYHRPRLVESAESWRGLSLSFEGWNTNPKSGPPGWIRMNTYSGKLAENVTQRVARDIQMNAIRRCEAHGSYPVVMHTYDEIVTDTPIGVGSVEELETLMTTPAPWHEGWPIKAAGGWRARRYRKG